MRVLWYYEANGVQQGPIPDDYIQELIRKGTITSKTLVWQPGMAEWREAGDVPGPFKPPPLPQSLATPELAGPERAQSNDWESLDDSRPKTNLSQDSEPRRSTSFPTMAFRFLGLVPFFLGLIIAMKSNILVGSFITGVGLLMFAAGNVDS